MNIKFLARIDAFIPGTFISWRIIKIPDQKIPAIEKDYELTGIEVVSNALNLQVIQPRSIGLMPKIEAPFLVCGTTSLITNGKIGGKIIDISKNTVLGVIIGFVKIQNIHIHHC